MLSPVCDIYIAPMGEKATTKALYLCSSLREKGFCAVTDICGRGLKAQMRYANKIGARFSVVLGDNELESGSVRIKNMLTGEEKEIDLNSICELLK